MICCCSRARELWEKEKVKDTNQLRAIILNQHFCLLWIIGGKFTKYLRSQLKKASSGFSQVWRSSPWGKMREMNLSKHFIFAGIGFWWWQKAWNVGIPIPAQQQNRISPRSAHSKVHYHFQLCVCFGRFDGERDTHFFHLSFFPGDALAERREKSPRARWTFLLLNNFFVSSGARTQVKKQQQHTYNYVKQKAERDRTRTMPFNYVWGAWDERKMVLLQKHLLLDCVARFVARAPRAPTIIFQSPLTPGSEKLGPQIPIKVN